MSYPPLVCSKGDIMALFTIADLHLSLSADKSMEIFKGWENYVERIDTNWRKIVSDDDTVVLPGDISWEMKIGDATADFSFINSLPGRKLIIKGNHDLWWTSIKKMNEFLAENNFDKIEFINNSAVRVGDITVCGTRGWLIEESGTDSKLINREALRLRASLEYGSKLGGELIAFLHYPPITEQQRCDELIDVLNEFEVRKVYYGHIHGGSAIMAVNGVVDGVSYHLISADRLEFTPFLVR